MYLSQLILNPQSSAVIKDLSDPYQLHRTIMSAYPASLQAGERVLYRLELQRRMPYLTILVQSHEIPEWDVLQQRGYLLSPAEIHSVDFQFSAGQNYRFRLLANPTKRLKGSGGEDGPRVGLLHQEDQLAWLDRKAAQNGFHILAVQAVKTLQPDGKKQINEHTIHIHHEAVRFDGILQVLEPELFRSGWLNGIGSAKGFGFGLLSLAPAEDCK